MSPFDVSTLADTQGQYTTRASSGVDLDFVCEVLENEYGSAGDPRPDFVD